MITKNWFARKKGYALIEVIKIIMATDKAVLCKVAADEFIKEMWIPKSAIYNE